MSLQGSLSIERMCQLAQVSRAGFYRSLQERLPVEEEMGSAVHYSADRAGTLAPPLYNNQRFAPRRYQWLGH